MLPQKCQNSGRLHLGVRLTNYLSVRTLCRKPPDIPGTPLTDLPTNGPSATKVTTPQDHPTPRCFVAYPSSPADRAESIESAVNDIQKSGLVDMLPWRKLAVAGRLMIGTICEEIKARQLFVADVTALNPNVLFELGYAIAHRKRVWLLFNPQIARARSQWDRFQLLTTIGFAPYTNSKEIVERFYREKPYNSLEKNVYDELVTASGTPSKPDALLYLRSDPNTDASIRVARRISSGPMRSVIDDPQEVRVQPFSWYVQQVTSAFAVVCHLISYDYADWQFQNAKHALIAGLAYGRSKPLLMLAHEPYESPLDYRDLLHKHRTAAEADSIFADWYLPLVDQYEKRQTQTAAYRTEERAQTGLRRITVGDPVAEFESDSIPDYFVPTAVYTETLQSRHSIVVGRKGTGKTATLYALANELSADPRNHVALIKPVGYELEGLMDILRQEIPRAEMGYLVESFWKFLLYTELAKSTYEQLLSKPAYYTRTAAESALCEFAEQFKSLISPEFSSRLESAVARLRNLSDASSVDRRLRISELLHSEMLGRLRELLGQALHNKSRVAILVDNLDKAWNPNVDLQLLSELLFGLLSSSQRATEDFARNASGLASAKLSFALFLRSDIYVAMLQFAKERDKLPVRVITWSDPALLKRVIEERFIKSDKNLASPNQVWDRYFAPTARGIPTWEYIGSRILPRPRDLIYLVKSALQFAVNRGRTRVEENDVVDSERPYSRFALDSLIVEAGARIADIEELLLRFVQSSEIVTDRDVADRIADAKMHDAELKVVISLLTELTFLGFEVAPNRFDFLYDEQDERKLVIMAEKTARETTGGIRRFRIHPAFHAFLEIKPHPAGTPGQMTISL